MTILNISFSYIISRESISLILPVLDSAAIPYKLEWNGGHYTLGFPELHIRQFAVVHRLLGYEASASTSRYHR